LKSGLRLLIFHIFLNLKWSPTTHKYFTQFDTTLLPTFVK